MIKVFPVAVQFVVVDLCVWISVVWKMTPEKLLVKGITFARIIIVPRVYSFLKQ